MLWVTTGADAGEVHYGRTLACPSTIFGSGSVFSCDAEEQHRSLLSYTKSESLAFGRTLLDARNNPQRNNVDFANNPHETEIKCFWVPLV
jgi:hypothetical protein